jgi:hypothetical protein
MRSYHCLDLTDAAELHEVLTAHSQRLLDRELHDPISTTVVGAGNYVPSLSNRPFAVHDDTFIPLLEDDPLESTYLLSQTSASVAATPIGRSSTLVGGATLPLSLTPAVDQKHDVAVAESGQALCDDTSRRRLAFGSINMLEGNDIGDTLPLSSAIETESVAAFSVNANAATRPRRTSDGCSFTDIDVAGETQVASSVSSQSKSLSALSMALSGTWAGGR